MHALNGYGKLEYQTPFIGTILTNTTNMTTKQLIAPLLGRGRGRLLLLLLTFHLLLPLEGVRGLSAGGSFPTGESGDRGWGLFTHAASVYRNPIIDADYSDPDVCRVGDDYYMTASSFQCFPGLQILHSKDLVHWELIGAALMDDYPVLPEYQGTELDWHVKAQHGNYVWAPSIRYHDGWFYIYCGDPDQGLFMTKTQDPRGPWEPIVWVMKGKGLIDCCPLWDEDGKAYLSHG